MGTLGVEHVAMLCSSRPAGGRVPVAVSIGLDHLRVACPDSACCKAISLFQQHLPTRAQVLVTSNAAVGHTEPVQALEFSPGAETMFLCSASHSATLLWDVDSLFGKGELTDSGKAHGMC
jgi:hypothetical protein